MSNTEKPLNPAQAEVASPLQIWTSLTELMAFRLDLLGRCLEVSENGTDFVSTPLLSADTQNSDSAAFPGQSRHLVKELAEFCHQASSSGNVGVRDVHGGVRQLSVRKTAVANAQGEREIWLVASEALPEAGEHGDLPEIDAVTALRLKVRSVTHALNNVLTVLYCRCDTDDPSPGEGISGWRPLVNLVAEQVRILSEMSLNVPR